MQAPTVLLFDLDGTLITTGGVGRRAMSGAFAKLHRLPAHHGKNDVFDGFSFAGMTDRAIARYALSHVLDDVPPAEIDRFLDAYLALLEAALPSSENYVVLPGVSALLESLAPEEHLAIGLGTGNVKRGAYAKLTRAAIGHLFTFGGFGCDAEDRTQMLRVGAERGAAKLGRPLADCRVVVIGDTPKDVAAAKGIGAVCIAVATGGFTVADLRACGAEHAVETLADPTVRGLLCRA